MNSFCYTRTLRPSKGYSLMFDIHSEITSTGDQVLYIIKDFYYKTGWRALKLSQHKSSVLGGVVKAINEVCAKR